MMTAGAAVDRETMGGRDHEMRVAPDHVMKKGPDHVMKTGLGHEKRGVHGTREMTVRR